MKRGYRRYENRSCTLPEALSFVFAESIPYAKGRKLSVFAIADRFRSRNQVFWEKVLTKRLKSVIISNARNDAAMAQLVEHILGKDEVISSTLISSSKKILTCKSGDFLFCFVNFIRFCDRFAMCVVWTKDGYPLKVERIPPCYRPVRVCRREKAKGACVLALFVRWMKSGRPPVARPSSTAQTKSRRTALLCKVS